MIASGVAAETARELVSVDGPPFNRFRSGWYWQVFPSDPPLRSWSLSGATLTRPTLRQDWPWDLFRKPAAADGVGPDGEPLRLRAETRQLGLRTAVIVAAAPRAAANGPINRALLALGTSLAVLALGLIGAIVLQVRLGLRPLDRLKAALGEVRSGRRDRLPDDQPAEIAPLVSELNSLLLENANRLSRARRSVANLAHGLRTPLSALAAALDEPGRDPDGSFRSLTALMDRQIRHHLRRARAAAAGGASRDRTPLRPRIDDLAAALRKIHAEKPVVFERAFDDDVAVACDAQDVDEMLGNLLDNAFKWARSRVRASSTIAEGGVTISIEDDGPGVPPEKAAEALSPGQRLDETAPGYGFGLTIARELSELYGGRLDLGATSLGGLKVSLTLPSSP